MKLITGDRGQRYEVSCCKDDSGTEKSFGWSNGMGGVRVMVESICLHPAWDNPKAIDRQNNNEAVCICTFDEDENIALDGEICQFCNCRIHTLNESSL